MNSALSNISLYKDKFLENCRIEIKKQPGLRKDLDFVNNMLLDNVVVNLAKEIYKSIQFCDFFAKRLIEDNLVDKIVLKNTNNIQRMSNVSLNGDSNTLEATNDPRTKKIIPLENRIEDYIVSIKDKIDVKIGITHIDRILSGLNKSIKNFEVLKDIKRKLIPDVLNQTIGFQSLDNIVMLEAEDNLKQLRNSIFDQRPRWNYKTANIAGIGDVEVESIKIKNFKKTIEINCEFSVDLEGKDGNGICRKTRFYFGSNFEIIRHEGRWMVLKFSFSKF